MSKDGDTLRALADIIGADTMIEHGAMFADKLRAIAEKVDAWDALVIDLAATWERREKRAAKKAAEQETP